MFKRENYYSKTEACKLFKLKPDEFEKLVQDNNIEVYRNEIHTADYSSQPYTITAKYVLKSEFEKLMKK